MNGAHEPDQTVNPFYVSADSLEVGFAAGSSTPPMQADLKVFGFRAKTEELQ
jgi:hypothetical protein